MVSTHTRTLIAGAALGITGIAAGVFLGFVLTTLLAAPQDKSNHEVSPTAPGKRSPKKSKVKLEEIIEDPGFADDDDSDTSSAATEGLAARARRARSKEYIPQESPLNFGSMQTKGIRSGKGDDLGIGIENVKSPQ
ncbi:hypothetical protein IQ06DRAFT_25375 [Phaeosphaeriaceae sp. SRC1lsM3a]|nr:hypothetical protein IQ06DRAFT_25375 [Stagonospora sp. SRC1lsM3a]